MLDEKSDILAPDSVLLMPSGFFSYAYSVSQLYKPVSNLKRGPPRT